MAKTSIGAGVLSLHATGMLAVACLSFLLGRGETRSVDDPVVVRDAEGRVRVKIGDLGARGFGIELRDAKGRTRCSVATHAEGVNAVVVSAKGDEAVGVFSNKDRIGLHVSTSKVGRAFLGLAVDGSCGLTIYAPNRAPVMGAVTNKAGTGTKVYVADASKSLAKRSSALLEITPKAAAVAVMDPSGTVRSSMEAGEAGGGFMVYDKSDQLRINMAMGERVAGVRLFDSSGAMAAILQESADGVGIYAKRGKNSARLGLGKSGPVMVLTRDSEEITRFPKR